MNETLYEQIGAQAIKELVAAFYEGVKEDELLLKMYPKDLVPAEERLYLFLLQSLGGPNTYSEQRGHPRLRMRHFKFPVDENARDHWLACMDNALTAAEMPEQAKGQLQAYFYRAAQHMVNR